MLASCSCVNPNLEICTSVYKLVSILVILSGTVFSIIAIFSTMYCILTLPSSSFLLIIIASSTSPLTSLFFTASNGIFSFFISYCSPASNSFNASSEPSNIFFSSTTSVLGKEPPSEFSSPLNMFKIFGILNPTIIIINIIKFEIINVFFLSISFIVYEATTHKSLILLHLLSL